MWNIQNIPPTFPGLAVQVSKDFSKNHQSIKYLEASMGLTVQQAFALKLINIHGSSSNRSPFALQEKTQDLEKEFIFFEQIILNYLHVRTDDIIWRTFVGT